MTLEIESFEDVVAIDFHVHIELGPTGEDQLSPELRRAASRYFKGDSAIPTADDIAVYYRERQATEILRILQASENDPTFGFQINNFRHCLQSATMALRAAQRWTGTSARNGAGTRPSSARWSSSPCSTRTPWIPITVFCR